MGKWADEVGMLQNATNPVSYDTLPELDMNVTAQPPANPYQADDAKLKCSDRNHELAALAPLLGAVMFVAGYSIYWLAAPPDHPGPVWRRVVNWISLALCVPALAAIYYYAVRVLGVRFSEIDFVSSSFDQPCQHQPDLPRSKCPERECNQLHRLSNIKFFLSTNVTVFHLLLMFEVSSQCRINEAIPHAYSYVVYKNWHELFLMNTYTFISGLLSAPVGGSDQDHRRMNGTLARVIVLYLVNQAVYIVFLWYMARIFGGGNSLYDPGHGRSAIVGAWLPDNFVTLLTIPIFHLWYLKLLAIWRVVAPYWARLRYPLTLSVTLGLFSGYVGDGYLGESPAGAFLLGSFRQTWGLFPFYVLGLKLQRHKFLLMDVLDEWSVKAVAVGSLVISWLWTSYAVCGTKFESCEGAAEFFSWYQVYAYDGIYSKLLESEENIVRELTQSGHLELLRSIIVDMNWKWVPTQMGIYMFTIVMVLGVCSLVPNKRVPVMTEYGSRSLTNYIYHMIPAVLLGYTSLFDQYEYWRQIVLVLIGICISMLLMTPWASFAVSWLINPPLARLDLMLPPRATKPHSEEPEQEHESLNAWSKFKLLVHRERGQIATWTIVLSVCLGMWVLVNPWKHYWEHDALDWKNPMQHLRTALVFSTPMCPEWAQYNQTQLDQFYASNK